MGLTCLTSGFVQFHFFFPTKVAMSRENPTFLAINFWLVVWNMVFIFHTWDVIIPIDEVIFFKMVKTTNQ